MGRIIHRGQYRSSCEKAGNAGVNSINIKAKPKMIEKPQSARRRAEYQSRLSIQFEVGVLILITQGTDPAVIVAPLSQDYIKSLTDSLKLLAISSHLLNNG